jgi:hypothetical protein
VGLVIPAIIGVGREGIMGFHESGQGVIATTSKDTRAEFEVVCRS